MCEDRNIPAHGPVDQGLAECVGQVIVAAHDMGDIHVMVVDDNGQHVGRRAVSAQQDHVVELVVAYRYPALDRVVDDGFAVQRRAQPQNRRGALGRIGRIPVAPGAVVKPSAAPFARRLPHRRQFFRAAIAAIGIAGVEQCEGNLGVPFGAGGLVDRRAVPFQAEPVQAVQNRPPGRVGRACPVGILDTQQEPPAMPPREEPVEQGGPGAADMEKARRRRGKTGNDSHRGFM